MSLSSGSLGSPLGATRPRRPSLRRRVRRAVGTIGTYALLVGIGIVFIFPFVFMFTTSLKTSEEVFRYPPQVLPTEAKTVLVEGEDEPVEVYRIPLGDSTYEMIPVDTGVAAGVFVDPADPAAVTAWPLDQAVPVLTAPDAAVDRLGQFGADTGIGQDQPNLDLLRRSNTARGDNHRSRHHHSFQHKFLPLDPRFPRWFGGNL